MKCIFAKEKLKTKENKRIVKFDFLFLSKLPFLGIYLKKSAHSFLVHGHSSWSTFNLHLLRGPKALEVYFLRNWTMDVELSSRTMEKGHFPWSDFMVHGVNQTLLLLIICLIHSLFQCKIVSLSATTNCNMPQVLEHIQIFTITK